MKATFAGVMESFYTKIIVGAVVAIIGLTLGIKFGYALIGQEPQGHVLSPSSNTMETNYDLQLSFGKGDMFPPESFVDASGETHSFDTLFTKDRTVLLFTDFQCDRCTELLEFWSTSIESQFDDEIKTVVCLDLNDALIPGEYVQLLKNKTVIWYDRLGFQVLYDLRVLPTMVVVGPDGLVQFYIVGFGIEERQSILFSFS